MVLTKVRAPRGRGHEVWFRREDVVAVEGYPADLMDDELEVAVLHLRGASAPIRLRGQDTGELVREVWGLLGETEPESEPGEGEPGE